MSGRGVMLWPLELASGGLNPVCVTLGMLLSSLGLSFLICKMGIKSSYFTRWLLRIK